MFGSIAPPMGSRSNHVQSKEQTLEGDVYRHAKLAKKEMKASAKAEHKAQKVHIREKRTNSRKEKRWDVWDILFVVMSVRNNECLK